ncbi:HPP-domain-containing protein [Pseudovirgaria hyperparasitica]|uniref:HPP-domain-containing protein n=1 Tax=Pseudovirgaria hyperparasitica TaxID=470096 RepID=A0A6A6W142_9PEZI|nr:HPP-domain-containing protein [Pseudovirgaria hyperparasitica]KAF2755849.1 HPP-domain-containing protein [Pseudovirgaria hyperparasitica]
MKYSTIRNLSFDVDDYVNPYLPRSQVYRLPRCIAWFLGYRKTPRKDVGNVLIWWWSFFGAFCGIAAVCAIFKYSGALKHANPPIIIASFGASAVLEYGVIGSPLGQPRNCILGHFLSALSGICITKLFKYSDNFEEIKWLAGAVAVGLASSVMTFTNTAHPPGGATALLAAIDPDVEAMGWTLLPYVLIGTSVMLGIALLVNNIQRTFPVFWWTPRDVGGRLWNQEQSHQPDLEALEEQKITHATDHGILVDVKVSETGLSGQHYIGNSPPVLLPPVIARSSLSMRSTSLDTTLDRQITSQDSISANSENTMVHDGAR